MQRLDLTGKRSGKLVVIGHVIKEVGKTQKRKLNFAICQCDCGNIKEISAESINNKRTKSCGCILNEIIGNLNYAHGLSKSVEYKAWQKIKERCYNKTCKKYPIYGQRGIKVCDRWKNDFLLFLEDMGKRPSNKTSIDRIDVNGDYCLENCRWADSKEQANNTRKCVYIEHEGVKLTLKQWSEKLGVNYKTFFASIKYKNKTIKDYINGKI